MQMKFRVGFIKQIQINDITLLSTLITTCVMVECGENGPFGEIGPLALFLSVTLVKKNSSQIYIIILSVNKELGSITAT